MGRIREGWGGCIYLGIAIPLIATLAVKCGFDASREQHLVDAQHALISTIPEAITLCMSNRPGGDASHPVLSRREVLIWNIATNSEHSAGVQLADKRWNGENGQPPPVVVVISETHEEVGSYGAIGYIRAFANNEHLCAIDTATGQIVARKTERTVPPPTISIDAGSDGVGFDYIAHAAPEIIADIAISMSGGR
jgi:hypothetical protein